MNVRPTPADIATATAFVDGPFREGRSEKWIAEHREKLIRQTAGFAMMERMAGADRSAGERIAA